MGMGKSLSLIALVMHTLDHARSSRARYKELHTRNGQGGIPPRATLIVTPKSSTDPLSIVLSCRFPLADLAFSFI